MHISVDISGSDTGLPAIKRNNNLEIVVAHYNEDLSWLKPAATETTIYTKGTLLGACFKKSGSIVTNVKYFRSSTERKNPVPGHHSAF